MAPLDDDAPQLSVSASPNIRLYKKPDDPIDYTTGYTLKDFEQLTEEGVLSPSITTVLDVLNAPYLIQWAVNKSAREAVRIGRVNPARYEAAPEAGYKYLRSLHTKDLNFAASRGTRLHKIMELKGQNLPIPLTLTDEDKACMYQFEKFVDEYNVKFVHHELTGFGVNKTGLGVAGTTDFIANIGGKKMAGDYKCSTLHTPITMADGSVKEAQHIKEGDLVVAWTPEKNLHAQKVSWVADNGTQPIIRIETEQGQTLEVTENHPVLVMRHKRLGWVKAAELLFGETIFLGSGWNQNPNRETTAWGYRVSPYAVGVIWALLNNMNSDMSDNFVSTPTVHDSSFCATHGHHLADELQRLGIKPNQTTGEISRTDLLAALNRNNPAEETPFLELFENPATIPSHVFTTDLSSQEAFITGVRQVFFPTHPVKEGNYTATLNNADAALSLQHLYLNLGILTTIGGEKVKAGKHWVTAPKQHKDENIQHGPIATKVVAADLLDNPQPTIAIEVEGAHTHITGGIITHNTTRSGLHNGVALQLTAFKNTTTVFPAATQVVEPTPELDAGIAVHIAPNRYHVKLARTDDAMWDVFSALRDTWQYYAFDGRVKTGSPALSPQVRNLDDLLGKIEDSK